MKTATVEDSTLTSSHHSFVSDLAELVKARLTLLVLLTTAVGFYLGSETPIDYRTLFNTVLGTAAAAAGASALNQWWERRADALMRRTRTRPIPAGRMSPLQALALGAALSVFGVLYLAIVCNTLSAILAAITIAIYIFAYTPLKRASTANTARRRDSGRYSSDDRLGGCARGHRSRRVESLHYRVLMATAALLCHRLDVPRRLFARWFPHDFERRCQRRTQRQSKCVFLHSATDPGGPTRVCWNCELRL